jgi:hypothetical protein
VANRNGFYYTLGRESGEFLRAKAFAKQDWNGGFNEKGRPIKLQAAYASGGLEAQCHLVFFLAG